VYENPGGPTAPLSLDADAHVFSNWIFAQALLQNTLFIFF